jgi:RNA-dependent RNA polymerase
MIREDCGVPQEAFTRLKKNQKLMFQPSKYAARIAQAFTATDPSVTILRHQWEMVPDLGTEPYLFTDGAGTISSALRDEIWDALCRDHPQRHKFTIKPDVVGT